VDDPFLGGRILIKETIDHLSLEHRIGENLRNIRWLNVCIADHLGTDDHKGASLTETMASTGSNLYFISQMLIHDLLSELLNNF
jgi:hypothetical protein